MMRSPPTSTLFPYTTLSRSRPVLELHPRTQPARHVAGHRAGHLREVGLAHLVARVRQPMGQLAVVGEQQDRKSTRLNSSHANLSYAVFCLKKTDRDGTSRGV